MTEMIMVVLAIVAGAALSVQAAINGQLGARVGVLKSAFLTFSLGALVTMLLILFFESAHPQTLMTVPKWQLAGALFGVPYIIIMVTAVPRVGTAVATVAVETDFSLLRVASDSLVMGVLSLVVVPGRCVSIETGISRFRIRVALRNDRT